MMRLLLGYNGLMYFHLNNLIMGLLSCLVSTGHELLATYMTNAFELEF